MKHLNDEEIQKYMGHDSSIDRIAMKSHLQSCPQCRQQFLVYQHLYKRLADDQGFILPANFSENVIDKLESQKERKYAFLEGMLMGVAILLSVALAAYVSPLREMALDIYKTNIHFLSPFIQSVVGFLKGNSLVLYTSIVILILISFADRFILQARHH
ncbi:MAG: hypothetical protein ACE5GL_06710 [Calditrichia bacterium]